MFKTGQTKVRVMKRDEKGEVKEIHRGVVVQQGTRMVRVFDGDKDASQTSAEQFPIEGTVCWVEVVGEMSRPIRIAPELR